MLVALLVLLSLAARPGRGESLRPPRRGDPLLLKKATCSSKFLSQAPLFKGDWVDHPDPRYEGLYLQRDHCPPWAFDYDCRRDGTANRRDLPEEYNQVFQPYVCALKQWDVKSFLGCVKGRRLIFIGDASLRQMFNGLACLLHGTIEAGSQTPWGESPLQGLGEYGTRALPKGQFLAKEHVGEFTLTNKATVSLRSFSHFNLSLWDEVLAPFQPLSPSDILVTSFSAAYQRYSVASPAEPAGWPAWQRDIEELFTQRLAQSPAQVFYRSHVSGHWGGANGTFMDDPRAARQQLKAAQCGAVAKGEHWFEDYLRALLRKCGAACGAIQVLPVFHASVGKHRSHRGSYGLEAAQGLLDCGLYCHNVVDMWNVLLHNLICEQHREE